MALAFFISGVWSIINRTKAARVQNRTCRSVVRSKSGHSIRGMVLPFWVTVFSVLPDKPIKFGVPALVLSCVV
jgi:hypothetical protein